MRIFVGADHRGFELKNSLIEWLKTTGHEIEDCGPYDYVKNDDFVDYAVKVGNQTVKERDGRGILMCGSGAGVEIVANKIKGIRCSLGRVPQQIEKARNADDINVLAIASDFTSEQEAKDLITSFLEAPYDPAERHVRRIEKITALES